MLQLHMEAPKNDSQGGSIYMDSIIFRLPQEILDHSSAAKHILCISEAPSFIP